MEDKKSRSGSGLRPAPCGPRRLPLILLHGKYYEPQYFSTWYVRLDLYWWFRGGKIDGDVNWQLMTVWRIIGCVCVYVSVSVFDWVFLFDSLWQQFCNFPWSGSQLSKLLSVQSRQITLWVFEYLCHFSVSIMAVAQFVIYGFSAYNLHPDCCTALSLVASRLPSEVWALPLKMFSLGGLHLPIMQKLFTSRNFAQIMQSFYFHVPIPFWPYLLSTQIRTL